MYHLDTPAASRRCLRKEQQSITRAGLVKVRNRAGSWPGADWFNTVQAELLNLMSAAGIAPDKKSFNS
jgi:hypothetical protein